MTVAVAVTVSNGDRRMNQWLIALLLVLSQPLTAGDNAVESSPGFVDFGTLEEVYGEPRVMINIGGVLLRLLAAASDEGPETQALINDLESVRVNVYDTGGSVDPAREHVSAVRKVLERTGWQAVVQARDNGEEVQVFAKANATGVQGLTVMAVNSREAVFINIVGAIDPDQLETVLRSLDMDIKFGGGSRG